MTCKSNSVAPLSRRTQNIIPPSALLTLLSLAILFLMQCGFGLSAHFASDVL